MSGKGDKRRPTLRPTLADLGEQILREKDPDKKAELERQWHDLKWEETRKTHPHYWRSNGYSTD